MIALSCLITHGMAGGIVRVGFTMRHVCVGHWTGLLFRLSEREGM
jgi:hypothetical protein